ncbi:pirin family protein [Sporomusa sphaeroides]|uniref:pirin family protein n=1 Tax=Sporomusa sphaeroides TaxID=47679 RepID=UPI002B5EA9A6|nr:pirin family protein [Sporomusa sphaeroides]HML32741.1 pirin family protein [Sporomusa sphaeroides]
MNKLRTIRKIVTGKHTVDGAGVKLVRVIGRDDTQDFDPFLMLDAFDSVDPEDYVKGFPWHPHRGIETITYLIQGDIEHGDSLGNTGRILAGECQWMTAGSGILHQEMPKPSERMFGLQLWLNLPAKDKMVSPKYNGIRKEDIPVVDEGDRRIHILAGVYGGKAGAMAGDYRKPLLLDVAVCAGAEWSLEIAGNTTSFIYIFQGAGTFGSEQVITAKHAVLFDETGTFLVKAADQGIRFFLMAGEPLRESIAWGGPIVMNTREELQLAFRELEENKFIK